MPTDESFFSVARPTPSISDAGRSQTISLKDSFGITVIASGFFISEPSLAKILLKETPMETVNPSSYLMQNMQFVDYYRQYADEDSEESREEVAADETSETEKLFFTLERAEAVMEAFENLNYRERAIVSAHLGFCMECYSTCYYDNKDLNENGKPKRKSLPKEAFIDIAIDHGLASPDTADKTYRKALQKMKEKLKDI